MSIVYVHGVATRSGNESYESHWNGIRGFLERYVAPEISAACKAFPAYWGDEGVAFAWNGASRPFSLLFGQGAAAVPAAGDRALTLASLDPTLLPAATSAPTSSLVPAGPSAARAGSNLRLKDLSPDELSDLLATALTAEAGGAERTRLAIAADEVAHDPATGPLLASLPSAEREREELMRLIAARTTSPLAAQGAGGLLSTLSDRLGEAVSRVAGAPAFAVSTVLGELRRPVNNLATLFVGDVFAYLSRRGDEVHPGPIPLRIIEALRAAKAAAPSEPLIVLTHSMGGQIIYDLVSYFLPRKAPGLRIDYWCATASQVGLFEEMKQFLASGAAYSAASGNKVPFPDRRYLGGWWNVWDHNDFISYTAAPIFEGVDDEPYNSGVSLATAHGEYLARPSFYRRFAEKLKAAKSANWGK